MKIEIPNLSLVVLIGSTGSGKSTFARTHFLPTETISSDFCRGLVSDDENSLEATNDAFDVLHYILRKRLAAGRLTVVDATNVQPEARKPLIAIAREYHCLPVAIVLNMPEALCLERNVARPDRNFGPHVVRNHMRSLRASLRGLEREGFRHVFVLNTPEEVAETKLTRTPLYNDKREDHGPFDIIGDVHGCYDELLALLTKLGYTVQTSETTSIPLVEPPDNRKVVFLGDLCDRGPRTPDVYRLVMAMVERGTALCVPGNHDMKLLRKLKGKDVQITHGLAETIAQLEAEPAEFSRELARFLDALVSHYVFDGGKLVVAHAGMKEEMQGRGSGKVREFALYGETTGETDEYGLPVRFNWAAEYRGKAAVVYGHTPVPEPEWLNNTIDIDTGCVYGGKLTALRWPEREIVAVPASAIYAEPKRSFLPNRSLLPNHSLTVFPTPGEGEEPLLTRLSAQQEHDQLLELEDVIGKRLISTRLHGNITIREENAIAALEVMSRFAVNPKWLIYLPPTMSPSETSREEGLLEHPAEVFNYFRANGIPTVVCQEKHMGSRTVVVACRDEEVARRRFGVENEGIGVCVTRTGRRFFEADSCGVEMEQGLLHSVVEAMSASGLWERLGTDWICLDCELMPWSAKAQELLRQQYAAVGAAATSSLEVAVAMLERTTHRLPDTHDLLQRYRTRWEQATRFVDAYRRYCWPVEGLSDLRLAPFHILATESGTHTGKNHLWHMDLLGELCRAGDGLLHATSHQEINVTDSDSVAQGVGWWQELTGRGGEGMVVKPLDYISRGTRGLVQPALKCRGREYLRIIYGPEYTSIENLDRLRMRGLAGKRSLAMREFALGIEGLERFVRKEPLRRVHECVFGVLALESEPVDPRL